MVSVCRVVKRRGGLLLARNARENNRRRLRVRREKAAVSGEGAGILYSVCSLARFQGQDLVRAGREEAKDVEREIDARLHLLHHFAENHVDNVVKTVS